MKRTIIAAAVLATAASSAFAYPISKDAYIFNVTGVEENVGVFGWVGLFGCVSVSSTAGAVINNNQTVAMSSVTLNPLYQSYVKGSVTTSVDNVYSKTTDTGGSYFAKSEAGGFQASESSHMSKSSTSSSNGWIAGGSYLTSSASGNSSSSHTYHASIGENSGGSAFIAGGAAYAAGSQSSNSGSGSATIHFFPFSYGYNNNHSSSSSGYIVGAAGAIWGQTGYANVGASSSQTSQWSNNKTESSYGALWGASYSHEQSSASQSASAQGQFSSWFAKAKAWGFTNTYDSTNVRTYGSVTQYIDTRQPSTLTATTGKNAATGVTGNLGVNITEGIDNAQSNDVALASVDVGNVFGNAQIFNNQSSSGSAKVNNFNLNASIGDGSLASVSGNVGVNVASGIGNVQNNSLAGSMTTVDPAKAKTVAMVATDNNDQYAGAVVQGRFDGTAMLGAGALVGATGNIGVNIAGGVGNVQHNGLAIAALNSGH